MYANMKTKNTFICDVFLYTTLCSKAFYQGAKEMKWNETNSSSSQLFASPWSTICVLKFNHWNYSIDFLSSFDLCDVESLFLPQWFIHVEWIIATMFENWRNTFSMHSKSWCTIFHKIVVQNRFFFSQMKMWRRETLATMTKTPWIETLIKKRWKLKLFRSKVRSAYCESCWTIYVRHSKKKEVLQ